MSDGDEVRRLLSDCLAAVRWLRDLESVPSEEALAAWSCRLASLDVRLGHVLGERTEAEVEPDRPLERALAALRELHDDHRSTVWHEWSTDCCGEGPCDVARLIEELGTPRAEGSSEAGRCPASGACSSTGEPDDQKR